jgi:hypothetical protein
MKQFLIILSCITFFYRSSSQNIFPSSGNVGIGTTSPGTLLDIGATVKSNFAIPDGNILGLQSKTSTSNPNTFFVGNFFYNELKIASNNSVQGINTQAVSTNPSGNISLSIGNSSNNLHDATGSLTWARAFQGGAYLTGSGGINNATSFYAHHSIPGSGIITNAYGLYVNTFPSTGITNKYGVYVNDPNASNYFGGTVGIGTSSTGSFKLAVEGKIGAREIKVTLDNPWPDYVFEKKYPLMDILSLDKYITINKHLPGVPSANEIKETNGVELGQMTSKLMGEG